MNVWICFGQNSLDHVDAFFLAPIKRNPSWCTTRGAPNIIRIYKVTHKTTSELYIYITIIMIILIFFSVLWFWKFGVLKKNKKSFWVKFTLKKEIPQGMSPRSPISTKLQTLTPHTHKTCTQILKKGMSLEHLWYSWSGDHFHKMI